mmetsp:Transcript_98453/g.228292  ORF Transcript_98453/g.228292 Transcript_98453/m.228292 type:complete len:134 (-) Transcript_98453:67-468(-)
MLQGMSLSRRPLSVLSPTKPAKPSEPEKPQQEVAQPRAAVKAMAAQLAEGLAKSPPKPLLLLVLLSAALLSILTWGSAVYVAAPRLSAAGVGAAACAALALPLRQPVAGVAWAAVQAARVAMQAARAACKRKQ